jgi:hypothetical protein
VKEEAMVELAQSVISDDTVRVAAVFQPKGAIGLDLATMDNLNVVGSFTNSAVVNGLPAWTLLAVSDTRIYVIAVRSVVQEITFDKPKLVGWFDREHTTVSLQMKKLMPSHLILEDETTGRTYDLMSSASTHSSLHANFVFDLLQSGA